MVDPCGVDTVDQIERGAARRCGNGISDREWTLIREVTNLTSHSILEGNSQTMVSWQHRVTMEFYCGLHLARFANDTCIADASRFSASRDWYWSWRFAIEMPKPVADEEVRTATLAHLCRVPAQGRRPNELIYRAWKVMDASPAGPEPNCPVICVTWYDAWCYAQWCGARLPTEVEWEYACRAGTKTRYWWGNNMDKSKCTTETSRTTPASKQHANPWQLMEMSGNVYEWCDTWYASENAISEDPLYVGDSRVLRGG